MENIIETICNLKVGEMVKIDSRTANEFVFPKHYSGRKVNVSIAFGWIVENDMKAVVTFGKPASDHLCRGICGVEYSKNVHELSRLCRTDDFQEPLSHFVGRCLRYLRQMDWIIVSYADTVMNHVGSVYQALNFIYTGATRERTVKYTEGNKHCRHYKQEDQGDFRKVRTSKHRYVYFCTNNNKLKTEWNRCLSYKIEPYPKGENIHYTLGEYIEPIIVPSNIKKKEVELIA